MSDRGGQHVAKGTYHLFDKNRSVTVSDGTPIVYAEFGHGSRPPVVLANGWSCSDVYWADVVPFLVERGHRVLLSDTRGHGESGLPRAAGWRARNITTADMSLERVAADLLEVCDDADIDSAVFIGHSMGVQTILETYRMAPHRVRALIAVAGPYENPMKTFYGQSYVDGLYPVASFAMRLMPDLALPALRVMLSRHRFGHWGAIQVRAATKKLTRERFTPYLVHLASRDPRVLFKLLDSMRQHSAADLLPELDVPLLILAAGKDMFSPPRAQRAMHELAPTSEIVWFEDAGHTLPLEEPEGVTAAIGEFLDKLEAQEKVG